MFTVALLAAMLGRAWGQTGPTVVINELHTNPDIKTERVEFVELYNFGTEAVDLSGWCFVDGISYAFPAGATLGPDDYLIVVQDREQVRARWSSGRTVLPEDRIFGPFEGETGQ